MPNLIKGYRQGIKAFNSNLNVYNTVFRDAPLGVAVTLEGYGAVFHASIHGLGSSGGDVPLVNNYGSGVISNNYSLTVQNARFKNSVEHVRLAPVQNVTTLPVSLNLTSNRFELFAQFGIICQQSKFSQATIQNNTIIDDWDDAIQGQTRYGIRWQLNAMTSFNYAQIVNNTIKDVLKISSSGGSEYWRHHGIQVSQSSKVNVELNVLSQDYQHSQPGDTRSYEGIGLFTSPLNEVKSNQIVSGEPSLPDFFVNKGVYISESGNNLISCNNVDGFYNGFDFQGPMCDKTQLKGNIIEGDNLNGLYLTSGTIIGQQNKKDNVWPGSGSIEALFDGDPDQFFVALSKFTVSTPDMNSAFWADPRIPVVSWFVPPTGQPTPQPPSELCYRDPDSPKSGADEQAITGGFQAYKDYPASLWEAQLNAYGTLAEHPELLTPGSADLQFYNTHHAGNIGKLSRAVKDWEVLAKFSASFENAWDENQSYIAQKIEAIRTKYLEMAQAQTAAEQEQIAQEIAALETDLLILQETNQNLSEQYRSDVVAKAGLLLDELGDITAVETWEENLKTVLTLLAQNAGSEGNTWTSAELNTLQNIADQCRFAGGIGVVIARAAIDQLDYDDQAMCPGYGERSDKMTVLPAKFTPNPATDICTIAFNLPTSATLLVSDLQGRARKTFELNEAYSLALDTSDLPNGLYSVSILDTQGRQFLGKLAILR